MGKTLIQKLVEMRTGRLANLHEIIQLPVDLAWGSEVTLKQAIDVLRDNDLLDGKYDAYLIENSPAIVFPFDHLIPVTDVRSASTMVDLREFAHRYRMRIFEVGFDGWNSAPSFRRTRPAVSRHRRCWCGLPFLYLRCTQRHRHRYRSYRSRSRNGLRQNLDADSTFHQGRT